MLVFLIVGIGGYGPVLVLFGLRELEAFFARKGWKHERYKSLRQGNRILFLAFMLAWTFFGNLFTLLIVLGGSVVVAAPVLLLLSLVHRTTRIPGFLVDLLTARELPKVWFAVQSLDLSIYATLPIVLLAFIYGLAHAFSMVMPPLFPIKQFFAGLLVDLKLGLGEILSFLVGCAVGTVLVGTGPLGLLYEHLYETVIANGVAGACLGLSLFRREREVVIGDLIRLGQARCLLRLKRRAEARYRINEVLHYPTCEALRTLAWVLSRLESRGTDLDLDEEAVRLLNELYLEANDAVDKRYQVVWRSGLLNTYSLAQLAVPM